MSVAGRTLRFGPFTLDPRHRTLVRGLDPVRLPGRSLDVLLLLAANPGRIVSKKAIDEAVWSDCAVTDNAVCQAVSDLRRALGRQDDGADFVDTLHGKGYRFASAVEEGAEVSPLSTLALQPLHAGSAPAQDIEVLLDPYEAFVDGRTAIESMDREAIQRARTVFAEAVEREPAFAGARIGLAHACVMAFEATRVDASPDVAARTLAEHHAREACRLDPASGHAWSVLALVSHAHGASRQAIAAARKAIVLQPAEWRHYLRLAQVSWGGERLDAVARALSLCKGLGAAHWFAAIVFIARGELDAAQDHLHAGCAAQDAQSEDGGRLSIVGLHWLHGLVISARSATAGGGPGDGDEAAIEELRRELSAMDPRHVYARECTANTWYAIGALLLRLGRLDEARAAFEEALASVPAHPLAALGLAAAQSTRGPRRGKGSGHREKGPGRRGEGCGNRRKELAFGDTIEGSMVGAAMLVVRGDHDEAARLCREALVRTEPGSAGWLLPVEPLLRIGARREAWTRTLDVLRGRAV